MPPAATPLTEDDPRHGQLSPAVWYRCPCHPCHAARTDYQLRWKYGISYDDYQEMFARQGGLCAICGEPETTKRKEKLMDLAVDHDHNTGRVRGLLCRRCNTGIGSLRDDPSLLRAAASYLDKGTPGACPTVTL